MKRRRRFVQRNSEVGHERLFNDYLSTNPMYPNQIFQRRFRMRRKLFLSIVNALENCSSYFQQRDDAARRKDLSPLQKYMTAIRQLAYGDLANILDEYLHRGESTGTKCLFKVYKYVVKLFGNRYFRRMLMMFNVFFKCMMRDTTSLECWANLIACTENGKNV
ncbi:uncharacterized protein [Primulina huaijiensis]|uniref:uncharacterized protein n=1 Tax=Primulina huaijiensis TaxID=1492673 RepID=UPI003CC6DD59